MNCVNINSAEAIIEPFWDCGESYPDNYKYSRLDKYHIAYAANVVADVRPSWYGIKITVEKPAVEKSSVIMQRDCQINIEAFDLLRICAAVNEKVKCKIFAVIDRKEYKIMDFYGKNMRYEYDGKIAGKTLTHIRLEIENTEYFPSTSYVYWIGIANSLKEKELRIAKSGVDSEWEGCFNENYEIAPYNEIHISKEALRELRKKVLKEPFMSKMNELRATANNALMLEPEKYIGDYYTYGNKQIARVYEYEYPELTKLMSILSFVGLIDENKEMLKMSCRMALSLSACKSWEESFICNFPGCTWSRRSFSVSSCCSAIAKVIDFAGNLLTWHGKNILYQALIMKGLPRIEGDFNSIEYIRHCNQGIVFSQGRIEAYATLSKVYPRYEKKLVEAQNDLVENLDEYITEDGGVLEGPSYWNYTITECISPFMILSRYFDKSLKEVIPDSVKKSSRYGLAMLSDKDDLSFVPVNDCGTDSKVDALVASMYAIVDGSSAWREVFSQIFYDNKPAMFRDCINTLILAPNNIKRTSYTKDDFISINDSGQTTARFNSDKAGEIRLHVVSGKMYFAHTQEDKGSFVLEANGKPVLIDRGYGHDANDLTIAQYHNLFCPVDKTNTPIHQKSKITSDSAKVLKVVKEYNSFFYQTDTTKSWENDIFIKNIRTIEVICADTILITDDIEYIEPTLGMFILNSYDNIEKINENMYLISNDVTQIYIRPRNWKPTKAVISKSGTDDVGREVNRICLYTDKQKKQVIQTEISIKKRI